MRLSLVKPGPNASRALEEELDEIWETYFLDVPRINTVKITYTYPWKHRLGLIRMSLESQTTYIGINTLLAESQPPAIIKQVTIAHELAHYAHGFGSPLPQLYPHPHAGNVVGKELAKRGLGKIMKDYDVWISTHWYSFYDNFCSSQATSNLAVSSITPKQPTMATAAVASEISGSGEF